MIDNTDHMLSVHALNKFNLNKLLLGASQELNECLNDLDQFLLTASQAYDKDYDGDQVAF